MKLSDLVASRYRDFGIERVYGLQGGAAVHLFDSFTRYGLSCIYFHHEQSAALAAVADAKVSKIPGAVLVTTGPAGTNAITGLLSAWQESVPCIFLSGQARKEQTSYGKPIRQHGSQECAIIDIVKPITKATYFVEDPESVSGVLDEAFNTAISGRPGPVWIDLPVNLQWSNVSQPAARLKLVDQNAVYKDKDCLARLASLVSRSIKPLLILGNGVHLSNTEVPILGIANELEWPFVLTWNSADLAPTDHLRNLGVIGVFGQAGANLACFNADLLLCLGTNLSIMQTGSSAIPYAPDSVKISVTNDVNQVAISRAKFDLTIDMDLRIFMPEFMAIAKDFGQTSWKADELVSLKRKNARGTVDLERPEVNVVGGLSADSTVRMFTTLLNEDWDIVIDGGGTALYAGHQSTLCRGYPQRIICSSSISSMGTGMAESVGVALARRNSRKVACIIGDGSFLMNIRDLATLVQEKIAGIIVVINNAGYLAIRHTQKDFLDSRFYGTDKNNGLHIPAFGQIVKGMGAKYRKVSTYAALKKATNEFKKIETICVLDVEVSASSDTLFKQRSLMNPDGTSSTLPLSIMDPNYCD